MEKWPFPYMMIATRNENKLAQFKDLFQGKVSLEIKGLDDFDHLPEVEEDQDTFEGNAQKKAETIAEIIQGPVIADDSGIVVPALNGAPGVYSARYAGVGATDQENNAKLINQMNRLELEERTAYYVCVMALAFPEAKTHTFRGECHGEVIEEHRGTGGFGYDPIFYITEKKATMAELSPDERYKISHRAIATNRMMKYLLHTYS